MIEYISLKPLREMGKQRELKLFNEWCEKKQYNSVQKLLASLFCRFDWDVKCPAMWVRIPTKGRSPIKDMTFERNMTYDEISQIFKDTYEELTKNNFGEPSWLMGFNADLMLVCKVEFAEGDWDKYESFITGKDGISIPAK